MNQIQHQKREEEEGGVGGMDHESLSNLTSASGEASASISSCTLQPNQSKRKRSLPGNPDPDSEVIALSPKSLMATNRFMCEICNKGFQRDQNLQLHRRGHNLPWKLKQRSTKEIARKKVYVCPEINCVHHEPSRALGDLTGIKKHFCRKHGEKKWKCDKCSKRYAVQSDWKAHSKICGTREYRCDCGTLFSRRDSFITHRAFCDALAEETGRSISTNPLLLPPQHQQKPHHHQPPSPTTIFNPSNPNFTTTTTTTNHHHHHHSPFSIKQEQQQQPHHDQKHSNLAPPWLHPPSSSSPPAIFTQDFPQTPHGHPRNPSHGGGFGPMSATALLQKAAQTAGSSATGFGQNPNPHDQDQMSSSMLLDMMMMSSFPPFDGVNVNPFSGNGNDGMTRDFLGLRPLSQSDILSLAGFANGSSSSTPHEDDRHGKSWQGQL